MFLYFSLIFQADCDVIKIDIQCLVQGDVVLECVHWDVDPEREVMMFRIMFNTAFIRSNILILNSENLDILWDSKERFPKGFRAEVNAKFFSLFPDRKAAIKLLGGAKIWGNIFISLLDLFACSTVQT